MKAEAAKFADQSSMDEVDMDYGIRGPQIYVLWHFLKEQLILTSLGPIPTMNARCIPATVESPNTISMTLLM